MILSRRVIMTFDLVASEKDYEYIQNLSKTILKATFLRRLIVKLATICGVLLCIGYILFMLLILPLDKTFSTLRVLSVCFLFVIFYFNGKDTKKIKSVNYINKEKNQLKNGTVTFTESGIIIGGVVCNKKKVVAVFHHKNYLLFTLKNKKCFLLQLTDEENIAVFGWLKGVKSFAWKDTFNRNAILQRNRRQDIKIMAPLMLLALMFWGASGLIFKLQYNDVQESQTTQEAVEKFTFDMSADIPKQIHHLYEYYESTYDFEGAVDIYYSYAVNAGNVLAKTNYKNGDMQKEKELLFTDSENFLHIKVFMPENQDYMAIEITDSDNTHILQKNENGYTVSHTENNGNYTLKDAFVQMAEIRTMADKYTEHSYAYYHSRLGTSIQLEGAKKEKICYIMGQNEMSFETSSKDKEFKIVLKNLPQEDVRDFKSLINSAIKDGTPSFSTILKEINRITTA